MPAISEVKDSGPEVLRVGVRGVDAPDNRQLREVCQFCEVHQITKESVQSVLA